MRKRTAARAAKSVVTGPFTTEYGPGMAGNRKTIRTQKTAITANSDPMRPEIIEMGTLYRETPTAQSEFWGPGGSRKSMCSMACEAQSFALTMD
jgi:hypothetical protein